MASIEIPKELTKTFWDKKKGAVPAGSPLETQLKIFEKKFAAVDFLPFAAGWEKKAKTAEDLKEAYSALDRAYRVKVITLKLEAISVADAAQKVLKDKGLGKPTLDAVKDIGTAAKDFSKAVDAGLMDLEKAHDKAADVLKSSDDGDEEQEHGSALTDPKRQLQQLQLLRRVPDRRVAFAYVSGGKSEPMFCLAPKMTGNRLFAKLGEQTGMKAGSFGRAWMIERVLYLEMVKPMGGLAKKVRAALQAAGFRVAKVVLASEDGTVHESDDAPDDGEDQSDQSDQPADGRTLPDAGSADPGTTAPGGSAEPQAYQIRRDGLWPRLSAALKGPEALAGKLRALVVFADGKADAGHHAVALSALDKLEDFLDQAGAPNTGDSASSEGGTSGRSTAAVKLAEIKIQWNQAKSSVESQLAALAADIVADGDSEEAAALSSDAEEKGTAVEDFTGVEQKLTKVLSRLNQGLANALDAHYVAEPAARPALLKRIDAVAQDYLAYVEDDPLITLAEENPYRDMAIREVLRPPLLALIRQLEAQTSAPGR